MNKKEVLMTFAIPLTVVVTLATIEYLEGWQAGSEESIHFRIVSVVIAVLSMPAARFIAWYIFGEKDTQSYVSEKGGMS